MVARLGNASSSTAVSLLVVLNVGVIGLSVRLTLRLVLPLDGDGGGGIATAEGIRGRGVDIDGTPELRLFGVPIPDKRGIGLGVVAEPILDGLMEPMLRLGLERLP